MCVRRVRVSPVELVCSVDNTKWHSLCSLNGDLGGFPIAYFTDHDTSGSCRSRARKTREKLSSVLMLTWV